MACPFSLNWESLFKAGMMEIINEFGKGKVAIVTGASNGMGKAIAQELASLGFNLSLSARDEKKLEAFREDMLLAFPNIRVLAFKADLSKKEEVLAFSEKTQEEFGQVHVLINNVGQYQESPLLSENDDFLQNLMEVNFFPAYYLCKFFGKRMADKKEGHIITIVSIAGKEPVLGAGAYSISKFALLGLSRNLRAELKPFGVKVSALLPGATLTGSWDGVKIDPGTLISAKDIAYAVSNCLRLSPGANMEEMEIRPL